MNRKNEQGCVDVDLNSFGGGNIIQFRAPKFNNEGNFHSQDFVVGVFHLKLDQYNKDQAHFYSDVVYK